MPLVQYHDKTYSPVGLWNFNDTLNDTSGNGFNMAVQSGNARYTEMLPGLKGLQALTPIFKYGTSGSSLMITGDLTIEMLIQLNEYITAPVLSYSATSLGGSSATNTLYQVGSSSTSGGLIWTSYHGNNLQDTYTISDRSLPLNNVCHFAITRTSNVIQFYLNGTAYGAASSALTAPTGGNASNTLFTIGGPSVNAPNMWICSLKVIASALTSTQILGEYARTLGTFYG